MNHNSHNDEAGRRRRIFLVDRHTLMRRAAAGWINQCSELEVCGTAGRMANAFHAVRQLRPDLVVSEIMRPQDLGFIRELHRRHPGLPILVFSIQDPELFGARARRAGARGFLTKAAGGGQLVNRIRALLRNGSRRPTAR